METKYLKSKENHIIKYARALHKVSFSEKENTFILEGERIIEEAVKTSLKIKIVFFTEEFYGENINKEYFKKLLGKSEKKYFVNDNILKSLSKVETNPGILVLAHKKLFLDNCAEIKGRTAVYLDNIKDPGNMGTIMRTALALGVKEIILSKACVCVYNDKVIRSSAGAVFKLELYADTNQRCLQALKNKDYKIYSTSSHNGESIVNFDVKHPCVIVFGEEAHGVSEDIGNISDNILMLPLKENVESLNVSVSVALFIYLLTEAM